LAERQRTRKVDPGHHRVYLQRAGELIDSVADAEVRGHSVSAGLAAVHAAIAAGDAVTVARLGLRSIGPDHEAAIGLLSRCGAKGAEGGAKQLKRVLAVKNLLAYEDRLPTEHEARDVAERARRLFAWASQVLAA